MRILYVTVDHNDIIKYWNVETELSSTEGYSK